MALNQMKKKKNFFQIFDIFCPVITNHYEVLNSPP